MPPLLCVPVGASIPSRFFVWTQDWTPRGQRWDVNSTPRRTDIARSMLIRDALSLGRDCWQWDSDVLGELSYEEMMGLISEDLKKGYDCVVAPTAGQNGKVLIVEEDGADTRTAPFPIKGPLCGMWYMTLEGLQKLRPIAVHEGISGEGTPMYCTYSIHQRVAYSEDMDLAHRAREAGVRICADPRLQVRHIAKMDAVVVA